MFRGTELPRLLTLAVMLGVLCLLIFWARDPSTWRWFASDSSSPEPPGGRGTSAGGATTRQATATRADTSAPRSGPTDEDPAEADAARREFQALLDRSSLQPEEMPAYWRVMSWVMRQPLSSLAARTRRDLLFTHLFQAPEKHRGHLVHLNLHLMRSLRYEAGTNSLGLKELYEAWGWTNESHPWPYVVVCPEIPPGMPIGPAVHEEASVDGYFFKLMAYEAHDAPRAAPLLVGRLTWHPVKAPAEQDPRWFWLSAVGGGIVLSVIIVRWVLPRRLWRRGSSRLPPATGEPPIERWLEEVETADEAADQPLRSDDGQSDNPELDRFVPRL